MIHEAVLRVQRTRGAFGGWDKFHQAIAGDESAESGHLEELSDGRFSLRWSTSQDIGKGRTLVRHCRVISEPEVGAVFTHTDGDDPDEQISDTMPWMYVPGEDDPLDKPEPEPGRTIEEMQVMTQVIQYAIRRDAGRLTTALKVMADYKVTEQLRARAKEYGLIPVED